MDSAVIQKAGSGNGLSWYVEVLRPLVKRDVWRMSSISTNLDCDPGKHGDAGCVEPELEERGYSWLRGTFSETSSKDEPGSTRDKPSSTEQIEFLNGRLELPFRGGGIETVSA